MNVRALDGVSLTIKKGEFCGIIGRNGAGKSTLLKIIAGHLSPTQGRHVSVGRRSLLQLGRGFNSELSGLENVRNALRLAQMDWRVSDALVAKVVEFSELGKFINFPLKTYSSGMYSRLAFATAVSIEPDILIADEVLAVGDINFTQKCLAKMREFKESGKTVVLVTHDLNSVRTFCDRAILIEKGKVVRDGDPQSVCEEFRNLMLYGHEIVDDLLTESERSVSMARQAEASHSAVGWQQPRPETLISTHGNGHAQGYRWIFAADGKPAQSVAGGTRVRFELLFSLDSPERCGSVGVTIHDSRGEIAIHLNSAFDGLKVRPIEGRTSIGVAFEFQMPHLKPGSYSVSYGVNIVGDGGDEMLSFKHDFDFAFEVVCAPVEKLVHQCGFVLVDDFVVRQIRN